MNFFSSSDMYFHFLSISEYILPIWPCNSSGYHVLSQVTMYSPGDHVLPQATMYSPGDHVLSQVTKYSPRIPCTPPGDLILPQVTMYTTNSLWNIFTDYILYFYALVLSAEQVEPPCPIFLLHNYPLYDSFDVILYNEETIHSFQDWNNY